jgi:hypothetical protein
VPSFQCGFISHLLLQVIFETSWDTDLGVEVSNIDTSKSQGLDKQLFSIIYRRVNSFWSLYYKLMCNNNAIFQYGTFKERICEFGNSRNKWDKMGKLCYLDSAITGKSIRKGWGNCIMKKVVACDYSVNCWQVDKTHMAQGRITTPYAQRSAIVQSKCQHTTTL